MEGERAMLTVAEAAAMLNVTDRTIRARLEAGTMHGERYGKWMWLIPRTEVQRVKDNPPPRGRPGPRRRTPHSEVSDAP